MSFKEINFGYISAEAERAESPNLIIDGYFDPANWIEDILNKSMFLILGYKGTGKSALINRIDFDNKYDKFYTFISLDNFPFTDFFSQVYKNDDLSKDAILPDSWAWLILLQIVWSLQKDPNKVNNSRFDKLVHGLKENGFSSPNKFSDLLIQTKENKFIVHGPSIELNPALGVESDLTLFKFESNLARDKTEISLDRLILFTKQVIAEQTSINQHILFIDGLDRAIYGGEDTYSSIATLITESLKLNQFFRESNVPIKIVIACRTDLFGKLSIINRNSILNTYSIPLIWHNDFRDYSNCNLNKLVNFRAKLSLSKEVDVFRDYFPDEFTLDNNSTGKTFTHKTIVYIYWHTRNTPRDLLMALKEIQKAHSIFNSMVTLDEIIKGLSNYSRSYFLPEIKDELGGYLTTKEVDQALHMLQSLYVWYGDYKVLIRRAKEAGLEEDRARDILSILFECSAIGNQFKAGDGDKRLTYKYYMPEASLDISQQIVVHRGLWKAFNYV